MLIKSPTSWKCHVKESDIFGICLHCFSIYQHAIHFRSKRDFLFSDMTIINYIPSSPVVFNFEYERRIKYRIPMMASGLSESMNITVHTQKHAILMTT